MTLATSGGGVASSYQELAGRFRPIFERIGAGAVEREDQRRLPYEEVRWLKEAGFGALRVPAEFGGADISLVDLVRLLIELAEADSNLPQLLRGHIGFVETERARPDSPHKTEWFERIARREILFGNAQSERSATSGPSTTLEERDGRLVLNGRKYYSTGTLFADWIWSGAKFGEGTVGLAVPTADPGVTRIDDWDGFGQRLTGSGTTIFEEVAIDRAHVLSWAESEEDRSFAYVTGVYQLVLLASLAGIARRAVRDAVAFVQPRTRIFGMPGNASPRDEPLVQRVVGRVGSIAFSAEATVLEAARRLEEADLGRRFDESDEERYYTALVAVYEAQQVVIDQVLQATSLIFEVGGASATSVNLHLDRLWRNARTISSHNPAIYRERMVGDFLLNGTLPKSLLQQTREKQGGPVTSAG